MPEVPLPSRLLRHRVDIERLVSSGTSPRGNPVEEWQVVATDVPAYVWSKRRTEAADARRTVVVDDVRVLVRRTVDVTERDRIVNVRDESGAVYLPGVLYVRGVQPRTTHKELICSGASA